MNWILLVALLVVPLHAESQGPPPVNRGDQVRVWRAWPFNFWEEGTVVSLSADTLVMERAGYRSILALPLESLGKFEVRRGRGITGRHWAPVFQRQASSITPGTRVRIRGASLPGGKERWLMGTAVSLSADTLVMKTSRRGAPEAFPRTAIAELGVSRGKSRDRGVILGAAIGFVLGNVYYKVINPPEYQCIAEKNGGDCATGFFLLMDGASGVPLGALIGFLLFAEERWEAGSLALQGGHRHKREGTSACTLGSRSERAGWTIKLRLPISWKTL